MGFALAIAAANRGAEVIVLKGNTALSIDHANIQQIETLSADAMYQEALRHFNKVDVAIFCAAVSDYRPKEILKEKFKRTNKTALTLELQSNPDIAKELSRRKAPHQQTVGFALETERSEEYALRKLNEKKLDFIVLNRLGDEGVHFGADTNKVTIINKEGKYFPFPTKSKREVAEDILDCLLKGSY